MNNNNNIKPSAPNYESIINDSIEYINESHIDDLPDFTSTMNIRLNKTIDFLTEENKYFRDKINKLDEAIQQLKYKIISYKQMLIDKNIDKKDSVYCIICMDNNRNVLFKPCNHIVICDNCSGTTDLRECIICKVKIDSYEYAYLV